MTAEYVVIARVVKAQGRRGEVAAEILTDFPERFAERRRVYMRLGEERREARLEAHWMHKGQVVLKFAGVDDIGAAEKLAGAFIEIPREERAELEPGSYYVGDLVGLKIVADGREVGEIADVQGGAGEAPLLVVKQGARELLIPFAEEYVVKMGEGRVEMKLPPGMLELDAPLTEEEKRAQRGEKI
jgi:16S rRNA processing protein RimM